MQVVATSYAAACMHTVTRMQQHHNPTKNDKNKKKLHHKMSTQPRSLTRDAAKKNWLLAPK